MALLTESKKADILSKILVVEDDPDLREALVDTLQMANFSTYSAESAERALQVLAQHSDLDLIVSDVNMGKMSGHDLLKKVKVDFPYIPMLLITAYASITESVLAMKEGAVDYLVKPFEPQVLIDTVKKFVGPNRTSNDEPIAVAESSQHLLQLARRVAQSDSTVLLIGESGTGKEVLAKYVHDQSVRSLGPFIAINCAAIPENMLEAMLFGHEKGAYTGAHNSAPGKFEQANGGTLLLDEISEMDMGLQAKLLRVLQEREVERLGGRKSIKLDVRVIATSNRDMRLEVEEGRFREDLYFRLSVLPLQWAPLRDRKQDILPLAERLMSCHAVKQHRSLIEFDQSAIGLLLEYPWPGNVRELDNVMQRALILQPGNTISAVDLGLMTHTHYSEKPSLFDAVALQTTHTVLNVAKAHNTETPEAQSLPPVLPSADVNDYSHYHDAHHSQVHDLISSEGEPMLGKDLRKHEFEIIVKAMKQEKGSKKNTADRLGISPRTLRYKLAKLRDEGYNLEAALNYEL